MTEAHLYHLGRMFAAMNLIAGNSAWDTEVLVGKPDHGVGSLVQLFIIDFDLSIRFGDNNATSDTSKVEQCAQALSMPYFPSQGQWGCATFDQGYMSVAVEMGDAYIQLAEAILEKRQFYITQLTTGGGDKVNNLHRRPPSTPKRYVAATPPSRRKAALLHPTAASAVKKSVPPTAASAVKKSSGTSAQKGRPRTLSKTSGRKKNIACQKTNGARA